MSQFYSFPARCLYGGREVRRPPRISRFPDEEYDPEGIPEQPRLLRGEPINIPTPDVVAEFESGITQLNDLDADLQEAFAENRDIDGGERDEILTYLNETEEALEYLVSLFEVFRDDANPQLATIRRLREQLSTYPNIFY